MSKLILGFLLIVMILIGGGAVTLYHFFGWKGLIAFPFILFVLLRIVKKVASMFFKNLGLSLLNRKSEALKKATITVHSVVSAPTPQLTEDDIEQEEPKHYYDIDLTITPQASDAESLWEPAELVLTSKPVTSLNEIQDKQIGFADQVLVWNDPAFGPDDPGKYSGAMRLKITFAVDRGNSQAWLHYYNESLGNVTLPPWTSKSEAPRARTTERTERSQREATVRSPAQIEAASKARRGDNFKTGAGKPEPKLTLYEPPSEPLDESVDPELPMDEVDAALDRMDARRLDGLPLGASRFGGVPDLPPNIPWPMHKGRKLPFLAQIDLSVLPQSALPAEGWLYAFALSDNNPDPTPIQVIHHRGSRAELVRAARPVEREIWKDWSGNQIYSVVPIESAPKSGWDSCGSLFGEIDEEGENAAGIADGQDCSGDDWITLMIIPSVGSMMWSDCGLFQIAIRRSDLAVQDFSKVCGCICCAG